MVETALIEARLTRGEEWIFAGGVLGLLELVEFLIYVTFILLGLGLRDELVHEGWHGFAHRYPSDLVRSLLRWVYDLLLLLFRKGTLRLEELLLLLLLVDLYRPFELLHHVAQ